MSIFYRTPIAEGFGLISILAGLASIPSLDGGHGDSSNRSVDKNDNLLRGATLSGKLKREVRLSIEVLEEEEAEQYKHHHHHQYELASASASTSASRDGGAHHWDQEGEEDMMTRRGRKHGGDLTMAPPPPRHLEYKVDGTRANGRLRRGRIYH